LQSEHSLGTAGPGVSGSVSLNPGIPGPFIGNIWTDDGAQNASVFRVQSRGKVANRAEEYSCHLCHIFVAKRSIPLTLVKRIHCTFIKKFAYRDQKQ